MTTRSIKGFEHTCMKCGNIWSSFLKSPKRCQARNCHSPYWRTKADPRLGGLKGGKARAKKLSKKRRREIASLGGKGRMAAILNKRQGPDDAPQDEFL